MFSAVKSQQILHWWFKALIETSLTDLLAYYLPMAAFVLRICYILLTKSMQQSGSFFLHLPAVCFIIKPVLAEDPIVDNTEFAQRLG